MIDLVQKAEALAAKVGTDIETVFAEFEAWLEGKKAAESPKEAEQVGETSTASTDSTSNITEVAQAETPTPDTTSSTEAPKAE